MVVTEQDRRGFQRLNLSKPILALMNDRNVLILDIGISGAYFEHYGQVAPGDRFNLVFRWRGDDIEYVAEAMRSTVVRAPGGDGTSSVSHTGVRFIEAVGESEARLQDMMATFVGRVLAAQKANATPDATEGQGPGAEFLAQLGEARRIRSRGYMTYRLHGAQWQREATRVPDQPRDGFTVAAFEDEDELETLCRTYETADEEGRQMIRLVAELSARGVRAR
jgi:hypothetical protein